MHYENKADTSDRYACGRTCGLHCRNGGTYGNRQICKNAAGCPDCVLYHWRNCKTVEAEEKEEPEQESDEQDEK